MSEPIAANLTRFSGFADTYDAHRPTPPAVVMDILTQLAEMPRPGLVVDIGCGTGLSSRLWAGRAEKIIGIEPNADMRKQAQRATDEASITYQDGLSTATGLADACADIVTCSQALHWMEPEPTLAEIARILRVGGVFAAVDCDGPPTIGWEIEEAYRACMTRVGELERRHGVSSAVRKWAKEEHLERMTASGRFRFTKEVVLHQAEQGDAGRLVGLARSQGNLAALLKHGLSEEEVGLAGLRREAERWLGGRSVRWYFSYRVRVGVK
jgi:ubiquinone/menaquinone biosynthesis C-methylase UbiE